MLALTEHGPKNADDDDDESPSGLFAATTDDQMRLFLRIEAPPARDALITRSALDRDKSV
jgi:hypothetical protein